ncbi:hypothetical protein AKJ61_02980 [candidate division MSBL1 archaeon SCGC-AAA259B11]|uniref:Uncharacterized protein n=1 Tax=candidate division MSBL1 archaeon SCGC-AAA259B11 TaxID=1698260 RepID=A0A133U5E2_9EURY|nr:hypothetical protein AKJ61_02980 [candidate division MSBL1 archaeon SCGC-AAA259B11]
MGEIYTSDLKGKDLDETRENLEGEGFRRVCDVSVHDKTGEPMAVEGGELSDEEKRYELWVSHEKETTVKLDVSKNMVLIMPPH